MFGPYELLQPGSYEVTFLVSRSDGFVEDGRDFCWVDVAANMGQEELTRAYVSSDYLMNDAVMPIKLRFSIDAPKTLEYRLHSTGTHAFDVRYAREVAPLAESALTAEESQFYKENSEALQTFEYRGAKILRSGNDIIADWMGIKVLTKSRDDLQLINEIFRNSSYNFTVKGEVCAIDVGMNVGMASLFFARMPQVRVVHSFEPFTRPFERALDNFALNPEICDKIHPNNVGLAGKTERLQVRCWDNATLSTSIRGGDGPIVDEISVVDATEALQPVIEEARSKDLCVVLKLDCEGSEFAILESLDKAGLLEKVNIVMMEWHKWWSAELTNRTILDRLSANGFIAFDFLQHDNPHASFIYASRA
jgi:FkbM family methyltransferase